ncbi:hypothetical protein EV361DRAFT_853970 [Lentinula raphanica]|nr:hypothetical protein EV361DRAFT_853970 [Lentinula raphanica]
MIHTVKKRSKRQRSRTKSPHTPTRNPHSDRRASEPPSTSHTPDIHTPNPFESPIREGIDALYNSSASFLVHSSPLRAETAMIPAFSTFTVSPAMKSLSDSVLDEPPATAREEELQKAVLYWKRKYRILKEQAISMQSSMVLNTAYCNRLRAQLAAQEESRKRTSKARLVGDGLPRLLTSEAFVNRVEAFQKAVDEKQKQQKRSKVVKLDRAGMKAEWEKLNSERVEHNNRVHIQWKEDCRLWDENKKQGKAQGPRPKWKDVSSGKIFSSLESPEIPPNS